MIEKLTNPARDAVVEAAKAWRNRPLGPPSSQEDVDLVMAVDRLAETGRGTASIRSSAAEPATPAPQDTDPDLFKPLEPFGLTAEQEIRARALDAAVRWFAGDDTTDDIDDALMVASRLAAFIHDGGSDA